MRRCPRGDRNGSSATSHCHLETGSQSDKATHGRRSKGAHLEVMVFQHWHQLSLGQANEPTSSLPLLGWEPESRTQWLLSLVWGSSGQGLVRVPSTAPSSIPQWAAV